MSTPYMYLEGVMAHKYPLLVWDLETSRIIIIYLILSRVVR